MTSTDISSQDEEADKRRREQTERLANRLA
jgi:hypothetical protein